MYGCEIVQGYKQVIESGFCHLHTLKSSLRSFVALVGKSLHYSMSSALVLAVRVESVQISSS